MRPSLIIILSFFISIAFGQLGEGIVHVAINEHTRIDFYSDTLKQTPDKQIQFFEDASINSLSIKNLEREREWLNPQAMWLDYSFFFFRCIRQTRGYYEVVANNDTGKTFWIKQADYLSFQDWEEFLISVLTVGRNTEQEIKEKPDETAQTIAFTSDECFHVKQMQGDWVEITTEGLCTEGQTDRNYTTGWIKWREGDVLLIDYYLTM